MINKNIPLFFLLLLLCANVAAQRVNHSDVSNSKTLTLHGVAELGYLAVLDHQVQFSNNGTYINYMKEGGQDVLFPLRRLSLEMEIKEKYTLIPINQPLRLESTALLERDLLIGNLTCTEIEADGFYAPVSYLNGSDNEVVGAILDASLRQGLKVTDEVGGFLNLRCLAGGAVGTSDDDTGPGDGYVKNWLHFLTVTAGFGYAFPSF